MESINSKRISGGTFYKLLLVGSIFTHVIVVLIVMVGALWGNFLPTEAGEPMSIMGSQLFFFVYFILGLIFMPFWAGVFWLCLFPGIWLYSKFNTMVLAYKPLASANDAAT